MSRWQAAPDVIAAVDLGSNSFHLAIARVVDGAPTIVDRLQERVALAAGLEREKRITQDAWQRAMTTLELFGQRLQDTPTAAVRAVGTDTLRVAANAREFLDAAETALGHPIEVIDGTEEARLIYRGVVHDLPHEDGQRQLVIDIGGGSTELVIGVGLDHEHANSLHMGCVSFSRRFFADGRVTGACYERAVVAAQLQLERLRGPFFRGDWQRALGASGTILAVQAILRDNEWSDGGITEAGVTEIRSKLLAAGEMDAVQLRGLKSARRPVFPGGLAILDAILRTLPVTTLAATEGALREGVMYDLLGRFSQSDVREGTIRQLMQRFQIDLDQAERVAKTALACMSMSSWFNEDEGLRDDARTYLGWAARLHEIGMAVSFHGFHKHGAYVVANSTMPGFSRDEQQVLANLVLAHRRKLARPEFDEQPSRLATLTRRLAVLLRLAVRLNRNRSWRPLPDIMLNTEGNRVEVRFPHGFLAANPLTHADFEAEAERLAAAGFELEVH